MSGALRRGFSHRPTAGGESRWRLGNETVSSTFPIVVTYSNGLLLLVMTPGANHCLAGSLRGSEGNQDHRVVWCLQATAGHTAL